MHRCIAFLVGSLAVVLLTGCAAPPPYVYRYVPGKTAIVQADGYAVAPQSAPADVQAAIAAGNRIAGMPYGYGAGHARSFDSAYDCSGAVSFILQAAGRLDSPTPSSAFRHYGNRGEGDWISIYARRGHVFAVVAGLRFDTAWTGEPRGPRWTTRNRPTNGYVLRHPSGL
jgi:hypothetical protein